MNNQVKISFIAALLMTINIIVGGGLYFNSGPMAVKAGVFGFLGWTLVAILLMPIVWGIAQAARVFPGEGGFYHYCKSGLNETAGFLANWAYLIGYLGTAATLISMTKSTLEGPTAFPGLVRYSLLFNILFILALSLLNLISVKLISRIQSSTTVLKLFPLIFVLAIFFFYWNPSVNYNAHEFLQVFYTIPMATFGYFGFESCCVISHMLEGGPSRAPKVIMLGFAIAAILYTTFHFGVMHIMGVENLSTLGALAFPQFLGLSACVTNALQLAIAGAILISFANTAYGASFTNIMNMHGLAKKNLVWGSSFLRKTTRTNIPYAATIVHALIIFLLITFMNNTLLLTAFTCVGIITSFVLTLSAVLSHFIKEKNIGQCLVILVGLVSCVILASYSWLALGTTHLTRLMYASPVIGGIILGYIMIKIKQRKSSVN